MDFSIPVHFEESVKLFCCCFFQCRLIVSTMSSQRCQPFNVMLYPLCVLLIIVPFVKSAEVEVALLVLYTAGVAIFHVHYGILLVSNKMFCRFTAKPKFLLRQALSTVLNLSY